MKKILVIAPYSYLPFFSGGQKYIAQFLEYLGKETDLTVVTVAENDFSLAAGYKTIPLLKKKFARYYDLSLIAKITVLVKKEKYDALIWEHPYYSWLAFRIRKKTGVKTIIHTHNIEYQRFRSTGRWWWPVLRWYEKRCFKKADKVFLITPEDMDLAINTWKIKQEKCAELPFGISIRQYPADRAAARQTIAKRHSIADDEKIIQFNGLLSYKPNLDALKAVLNEINPRLLAASSFRYKLIVCGKGLPEEMDSLKAYADKNIIFAGFTPDIETYFKATDIFLNPVQGGGGIKTKMVEGIAFGATVIATATGATGMDRTVCGNKLTVVADNDWENFAAAVLKQADLIPATPSSYYEKYYWGSIIKSVIPHI